MPGFIPGDFRIVFNYDRILWETGDASSGTNGLGGNSARVGFSDGSGQPGTFFELTGSGQNGALLDGGPLSLVGNKVPAADPSLPIGRYQLVVQNVAVAQADLAIAAEIFEDEDDTGFDLVVRNFGPSDAIPVQAIFDLVGRARIRSIRPFRFCEVNDDPRVATCNFPSITSGASRRIRVLTSEAVRGDATVASNVFDADLSNNIVRASSSCKGEILSRSTPVRAVRADGHGARHADAPTRHHQYRRRSERRDPSHPVGERLHRSNLRHALRDRRNHAGVAGENPAWRQQGVPRGHSRARGNAPKDRVPALFPDPGSVPELNLGSVYLSTTRRGGNQPPDRPLARRGVLAACARRSRWSSLQAERP